MLFTGILRVFRVLGVLGIQSVLGVIVLISAIAHFRAFPLKCIIYNLLDISRRTGTSFNEVPLQ